jgi:hypothetical protein
MAYGAGADQETQNVLFLLVVAVFLWHDRCVRKESSENLAGDESVLREG